MRIAPDAPSIAQGFRLLPANLKPPVPATNAGLYGYALDTATSPAPLAAAQAHLGRLAASGDPRGWVDGGELTPLRRFADMFSGWGLKGLDGTAWYHPLRLTIDAGAVAAGNANPAQRTLGLRAVHGDDLPKGLRIYAFAASLGGARVLDAARTLAAPVRHPPAPPDARRPQRHLRPQRPQLGRPAPQRVPEGADPVPRADRRGCLARAGVRGSDGSATGRSPMADRAMFVGFGQPVRGREERAVEVFNEFVGMFGRMQADGRIEEHGRHAARPARRRPGRVLHGPRQRGAVLGARDGRGVPPRVHRRRR